MSFRRFQARLRAAWAVLRAPAVVVLTYDPAKPPTALDELHTGISHPAELPARLANAFLVAVELDKMDSYEGQRNALQRAREILSLN